MAERDEKPGFEGKNRRVDDRRIGERRKFERTITIVEYIALIVFVAVIVKFFSL